ncbi:MAG: response regulator [Burkholderiales bacterium]|nr:response regulator [Burkholderiales bacterium]
MNAVVDRPQSPPAEGGASGSEWGVLCVDDEPSILSSLRRVFRPTGNRLFVATSGQEGLAILARESIDVVISDMRMPEMNGAEFLERVREDWPDTVRMLLTGYADMQSTVAAINNGGIHRYISKPWNDTDLLATVREALEKKSLKRDKERLERVVRQQNEELKLLNRGLEERVSERTQELTLALENLKVANTQLHQNFITTIKVFANVIEMRGGSLSGHSRRVADHARKIATRMGLTANEAQEVFLAGLLHDIGKIGLTDDVLATPVTRLTGDQLAAYRKHAGSGAHALMALDGMHQVAEVIAAHHEHFDGTGYPRALTGLAIPLAARIVAVANDYDGLRHGTLAPRRMSHDEAIHLLQSQAGRRYDPQVVNAFAEVVNAEPQAGHPAERSVSVFDLKPGMRTVQDVVGSKGVLLLAADFVLDQVVIDQMMRYCREEDPKLQLLVELPAGKA